MKLQGHRVETLPVLHVTYKPGPDANYPSYGWGSSGSEHQQA